MSAMLFPKAVQLVVPALRKAAEGEACTLRIENVCNGRRDTTVWAHSNMSRHGRGTNRKADDIFGCFACANCHYWLDYGKNATREEKADAFLRAMEASWLRLWASGKVRVT